VLGSIVLLLFGLILIATIYGGIALLIGLLLDYTTRLAEQAHEVVADKKSKKAEKHLNHSLLLRRLYRFVSVSN
jgi:hypothetical protein